MRPSLRPEKIVALEHDDYSRFPNNAYVKGSCKSTGAFSMWMSRRRCAALENRSPVNVADYQYLSNVPKAEPERIAGCGAARRTSLRWRRWWFSCCSARCWCLSGHLYSTRSGWGIWTRSPRADTTPDETPAAVKTAAPAVPAVPVTQPAGSGAPSAPGSGGHARGGDDDSRRGAAAARPRAGAGADHDARADRAVQLPRAILRPRRPPVHR